MTSKAPYGYKIDRRPDGRKYFTPTSEGLRVVPELFQAAADGRSMRSMAERFGLTQHAVGFIVRNPVAGGASWPRSQEPARTGDVQARARAAYADVRQP